MILFVKHVSIEGPGILGEFFANRGYKTRTIDLSLGEKLPQLQEGVNAVIVLGGPMNVYEEDKYPYLKNENLFIKKTVEREIPFLGICLGSQLLAKAHDAPVVSAKEKEIGYYKVSLTKEGEKDPLLANLNETFDIFQWHEDTFNLPENALLLATSETCVNQAFRIGKNAYGVQFHLECDLSMIESWIREYVDFNDKSVQEKIAQILEASKKSGINVLQNGLNVCANFEQIIKNSIK